jgi:hypothetical protein
MPHAHRPSAHPRLLSAALLGVLGVLGVLGLLAPIAASAAEGIDPHELDGMVYTLTTTTKEKKLPPALAHCNLTGWVLSFDGGKAVLSVPDAGDAHCRFTAQGSESSVSLKSGSDGAGELPKAQVLIPSSTTPAVSFCSVSLVIDGEIADKAKHNVNLEITGQVPKR